jgi:hypothetical protein
MGLYGARAKINIAEISNVMGDVVDEWDNAEIEIIDPKINTGAYDRATNTVTGRTPEVLWTGKARIQTARWPNVATTRQEAVSLRTTVFHIPLDADIEPTLIREGLRVRVTNGGTAEAFTAGLYVITTTVNSSFAWDRRIETMLDNGTDLKA